MIITYYLCENYNKLLLKKIQTKKVFFYNNVLENKIIKKQISSIKWSFFLIINIFILNYNMLIIKIIAFKYSKKRRSFFDIIVNNFILGGILLQFFLLKINRSINYVSKLSTK